MTSPQPLSHGGGRGAFGLVLPLDRSVGEAGHATSLDLIKFPPLPLGGRGVGGEGA